jgi:hypothetical protein
MSFGVITSANAGREFAPISIGGYGEMRCEAALANIFSGWANGQRRDTPKSRCRQHGHRTGAPSGKINVTTLISRGLQKFSKNMRNMLNMNHLHNIVQVFDFLRVRKKNSVFRCISHP